MSRRKNVTWVVLGPEPHLGHCERCGKMIDKPPLPTPIPAAVKYMEYAVEAHRLCADPKEVPIA